MGPISCRSNASPAKAQTHRGREEGRKPYLVFILGSKNTRTKSHRTLRSPVVHLCDHSLRMSEVHSFTPPSFRAVGLGSNPRPVEPMAEVREIRKIGFSPPLPLRPRQNTFTSPGPTTKANLNALNTASSWRVTRTLPPLTGCRGCLLIDWQANNRCIYQEDSDSVGSKKGSTVVQYLTTRTLHPPSLRSRLQTTQAVHPVTPERTNHSGVSPSDARTNLVILIRGYSTPYIGIGLLVISVPLVFPGDPPPASVCSSSPLVPSVSQSKEHHSGVSPSEGNGLVMAILIRGFST